MYRTGIEPQPPEKSMSIYSRLGVFHNKILHTISGYAGYEARNLFVTYMAKTGVYVYPLYTFGV
jgi:hypothetical protein